MKAVSFPLCALLATLVSISAYPLPGPFFQTSSQIYEAVLGKQSALLPPPNIIRSCYTRTFLGRHAAHHLLVKRSPSPSPKIGDRIRAAFQSLGNKIKDKIIDPIKNGVQNKIIAPIQQKIIAPVKQKVLPAIRNFAVNKVKPVLKDKVVPVLRKVAGWGTKIASKVYKAVAGVAGKIPVVGKIVQPVMKVESMALDGVSHGMLGTKGDGTGGRDSWRDGFKNWGKDMTMSGGKPNAGKIAKMGAELIA